MSGRRCNPPTNLGSSYSAWRRGSRTPGCSVRPTARWDKPAASRASWCRRGQSTQQLAAASLAISTDQGFPYLHAVGTIGHGRGLVEQGQIEAGMAQMYWGLGASQAAGIKILRPYLLALLAEACGQAGHVGTGLNYLAEAIPAAELHGERFYEAELYRLRGELSSRQAAGNESTAEHCFHQALDIARRQQARMWELRTAMRLARLWQGQGKGVEGRQLLAAVYDRFTEGFETADLLEARALWEGLA